MNTPAKSIQDLLGPDDRRRIYDEQAREYNICDAENHTREWLDEQDIPQPDIDEIIGRAMDQGIFDDMADHFERRHDSNRSDADQWEEIVESNFEKIAFDYYLKKIERELDPMLRNPDANGLICSYVAGLSCRDVAWRNTFLSLVATGYVKKLPRAAKEFVLDGFRELNLSMLQKISRNFDYYKMPVYQAKEKPVYCTIAVRDASGDKDAEASAKEDGSNCLLLFFRADKLHANILSMTIRDVVSDFLYSPEGKQYTQLMGQPFRWSDAAAAIPRKTWQAHGLDLLLAKRTEISYRASDWQFVIGGDIPC